MLTDKRTEACDSTQNEVLWILALHAQLYHLAAVKRWASYLNSLSLFFLFT